ncbi:hypothetical protein B8X04_07725 [Brevibacterium casei]|uniref:Uncharacterized protein n=1 Tax=Brevibacterium casei TaxID=33889 RepID=A0A269ZCX2_9MICO|nr:hypothetical protein [Brevibacterium casei]PAK95634.1 hypothetical protein B8X04_07725 [Brevibacterium casei]
MSTDTTCPPRAEVGEVVAEPAYAAFAAGWRAGTVRRTTQPASQDVIEQVATMLDAARVADALTQPE